MSFYYLYPMKHLVAPSILAANFGKLQQEVNLVNQSQADWIHVDIMDGRFVPNISFGFPVLKAIQQHTSKPLDVHLMIVEPERWITAFKAAGADILTVHYEACSHLHRVLGQIQELGMKVGVALNPHTPVHLLSDVIQNIDLVCLMSVNPGFGGQSFIPHTLTKVRQLKQLIVDQQTSTLIEIDGGVGLQNAKPLLQAGADVLVAGSSVFKATDPTHAIQQLKSIDATITPI